MIKENLCIDIVSKISYRQNVILIEFNQNMNVLGEHSYLRPQNYAIKKDGILTFLPRGTRIETIKVGYIIKIIFPACLNYLNDKCNLNLGYIFKNKIFYIESREGIVDFPYNIKNIGIEVEELNLKNGDCQIINSTSLKYLYKGRNQFSYIELNDFYVEKNNKIFYPSSFLIEKNKEIIFQFNQNIFHGENLNVYLKTKSFIKSKDIYGFLLTKESFIKIIEKSYIESLSFLNYESNKVFLKIKFSKSILNFNAKDFLIKYNNEVYHIEFLTYSYKNMVVDVVIDNIQVESFIRSIFKLIMGVRYDDVETVDYLENKIFFEGEIISKYFFSDSISWKIEFYNLKNSLINIGFQKEIIPSSIITSTDFTLEEKGWNGEDLIIPSGKIILSYNNNEQILSLSNNKEFGKIVISFKHPINYKKRTSFNSKPATLYLKEKNLLIKFNEEETLYLDFTDSDSIKYYPGSNIECLENYFIFNGYHPIGSFNILQNSIVLKPLKSEKENPFKGGIIKASYTLNVDNENKFRAYGVNEEITVIEGFLKVVGSLNLNEKIYIKNLKVMGKVYINIGNGNIELSGLECNDLLWN